MKTFTSASAPCVPAGSLAGAKGGTPDRARPATARDTEAMPPDMSVVASPAGSGVSGHHPTIHDVARLAGVSIATVSRVLNTPDQVSDVRVVRVRRAMEECGYRYNDLARGFATRRTHTLGLIVPSITNPVFAESTRGVQDYAARLGHQVLIGNTDYDARREAELIDLFRRRRVDGLLLTTAAPESAALRQLAVEGHPTILLYSTEALHGLAAVGVDNRRGGMLAAAHLHDLGHRRFAMLAGWFHSTDRSRHRYEGYVRELGGRGVCLGPEALAEVDNSLEGGRMGLLRLLEGPEPPTAVFCSNDIIAFGALRAARELGLDVPRDLSVVGFDGTDMGALVHPAVTSVRLPAHDIGRMGAEALFDLMAGRAAPSRAGLPCELVVRASTAPPGPPAPLIPLGHPGR